MDAYEKTTSIKCAGFGVCGGCVYQDIPYEQELELKEKHVLKLIDGAGIDEYEYLGITGNETVDGEPTAYRNKMEFSFGDSEKGGALALGIRKRRSYYEVVAPTECSLVDADFRAIAAAVADFFRRNEESFYHKRTRRGALRHLVVRKAHFTGEILLNVVTTNALVCDLSQLVNELLNLPLNGEIVSILHTVNDSVADVVKCDDLRVLHGRDFFSERLLGLRFNISAFSFFQTNSAGAECLYETVRAFAGDLSRKTVLDLYCGTGTIAQVLASSAERVTGVELVEEAVSAARVNAQLNSLENCEFLAGDVLKLIDSLSSCDLMVLDPPREGVHPKAMPKILARTAKQIVYVSCKPESLARDLPVFITNGYRVEKLKIHDMFPRTKHVECVVSMLREEN